MLRSLLSSALRSRTGAGSGGYGRGRSTTGTDPGAAVGAQVGRSLFSALRRRRRI